MRSLATRLFPIIGLAGLMLLAGCATAPAGDGSKGPVSLSTSLPISTLNAMYASRGAMISLAAGETSEPAAAHAAMQASMVPLAAFGERMDGLAHSFNDADYLRFWNQLASFGSLYQINTGTLTAARLRGLEQSLWAFKNDVHKLNRAYAAYLGKLQALMLALGPDTSVEEVQQHVPLVNAITEDTVELDVLIKDFARNLFEVAQLLNAAQI